MPSDRMPHGWLAGHRIRTAAKTSRCDYWQPSGQCPHLIQPGERYVEGNPNGTPGWGADRICATHAELHLATTDAQPGTTTRQTGAQP